MIHVLHRRYCKREQDKNLSCWGSGWAHPGRYEQSRCYDITCHIKWMRRRPLCFWDWDLYGWELSKFAYSLCIPTLHVAGRRLFFQQPAVSSHYSNMNPAYFSNKQLNFWIGSGGDRCFSGTLSSSDTHEFFKCYKEQNASFLLKLHSAYGPMNWEKFKNSLKKVHLYQPTSNP